MKPRIKPLAAHPCKLSEFHFLGGALSVGWAQLSYILALLEFFTLDIANDALVIFSVLAGCVVAQVFSSFQLAVAEREFGRPVHPKFCHRIQAMHVCMAWFFVRGAFAAIWASIFTYLLCPNIVLWLPLKRPQRHQNIPSLNLEPLLPTSAGAVRRMRIRRRKLQAWERQLRRTRADTSHRSGAWRGQRKAQDASGALQRRQRLQLASNLNCALSTTLRVVAFWCSWSSQTCSNGLYAALTTDVKSRQLRLVKRGSRRVRCSIAAAAPSR